MPALKPTVLKPGDTIAVVAPASPFNPEHLRRGIDWLRSLGYQVTHRDDVYADWRYLAGSDARRTEELVSALTDPAVSAVVCARGGYGASRLLPAMSQVSRPPRPVLFVGFSDVTILHLFLLQRWQWVTVHGPMVGTTWAGAGLEDRSVASLLHVLQSPTPPSPMQGTTTLTGGVAEGVVTGGNLSLLAHSVGTPHQADLTDAIVFLEDIHEAPYRVDRMLTQLLLSGVLSRARGVVLGQWTECDPPSGADFTLLDVFTDRLGPLGIPMAAGFPIGHEETNLTLPLGIRVRLDADQALLTFMESATIP